MAAHLSTLCTLARCQIKVLPPLHNAPDSANSIDLCLSCQAGALQAAFVMFTLQLAQIYYDYKQNQVC